MVSPTKVVERERPIDETDIGMPTASSQRRAGRSPECPERPADARQRLTA
ncbi:MAG: hypothetical protein AVDCRST_MAG67-3905 [uncultured Solirubrobacteraceae bacterium]|uniref:Uncharacterized protein n=1 Tax=uncultured Solirubrobacteraceae bacterium TaxID=1162706 RepID=A0A6J4THV4_9ACTN|nr:MAG: hypothetical protein AVDCRST_MAG67-3905 [uncultured Solirubrobacteraceae bacterium]